MNKTHNYKMKKIGLFLLLILFPLLGISQQNQIQPVVDERVELVSVVCFLANYKEYNASMENTSYKQLIEEYFADYREHPAVLYMKDLRRTKGMSHDGPMRLAVHLKKDNRSFVIQEGLLNGGFTSEGMDNRWNPESVEVFLKHLNDFYKITDFDDFFSSNHTLYESIITRFQPLLDQIDFSWFPSFFGEERVDALKIVLSEVSEGGGYGPMVTYADGREDIYAIQTAFKRDDSGMPVYDMQYVPVLIHEICHSFCNPLVREYMDELKEPGEVLFQHIEKKMKDISYGDWRIYYFEELVRASVIRYMISHEEMASYFQREMMMQRLGGFLTIDQTVELLGVYEENRQTYPSLESYMPELINAYRSFSDNIDSILESYPRVIFSSLGDQEFIPSSTREIILKTNQPMNTMGVDFWGPAPAWILDAGWVDEYTVRLEVRLEEKKEYKTPVVMIGADGTPPLEFYQLSFRTE